MSLVTLANACAHIQNCSRVRLSLTSLPYTKLQLQFAYNLYKQGFLTSVQKGSTKGPDETYVEVTPDNISTRRIWIGLKYRENKPILSKCQLISKPSARVNFNNSELRKLYAGKWIRNVKPVQPGELILIRTQGLLMDINEAINKNYGGEVLCRIS